MSDIIKEGNITTELMLAMFNVQQSLNPIQKDSTADVGKFSYKFISMSRIWAELKPLLKDNGLTIIQEPTYDSAAGGDVLKTTIYHKSGGSITSTMRLVITNQDPQKVGSAITYAERYALKAIFKIITDDDTDAREHRLATAQQKARMIGAVKQAYPDVEKASDIIETIQNIVGKHPGFIREDEAEDAIETIKAFTAKEVSGD
jgi:hypothetical protein